MARRDVELTEERLREEPLELLNASEEELRAWLRGRIEPVAERHLSRRAVMLRAMGEDADELREREIAEQLDLSLALVAAFRRAFVAITREDPDGEELSTIEAELDRLWREVRPPSVEHFSLWTSEPTDEPGGEKIHYNYSRSPRLEREGHHAWFALGLKRGNTWERIADLLSGIWTWDEPPAVLVCPVCGRIQERGRADQTYCSDTCRKRAWDRRGNG